MNPADRPWCEEPEVDEPLLAGLEARALEALRRTEPGVRPMVNVRAEVVMALVRAGRVTRRHRVRKAGD